NTKTTTWHVKIYELLKPTNFSNRYFATIVSLDGKKATGKILLSQFKDSTQNSLTIDNELYIVGKSETIKSPLNPHQFNYKKYMNGLGIREQLYLKSGNYIIEPNASKSIYGIAANFRNKIINNLKKENFGAEELSVIQALLLGQRNEISSSTYDDYKNAGAVHILALSGLHIGILLLLLNFLLQPFTYLPQGKTIKLVVTVCLLWGFALIAGLSASIVRAVTMFTFVAYAFYLNRPSNTFNILALSMFFILLLFDPNLLFQVGFQMSYAAVFSIVWIYPMLQKFWFPKNIILRKIWQLLAVSVAAQLGVLPISLYYFHQFPGLFFISNLLIIPALGIILGLGILVIGLSLLNILPPFLVTFYDSLIRLMNTIIAWVAKQESFVFKDISFDSTQLILCYILLISFVLFFSRTTFKRAIFLGTTILLFQLYTIRATYKKSQKQVLLVAHQTKNTILLEQNGHLLKVLSLDSVRAQNLVQGYKVAERISKIKNETILNAFTFKNKSIYRLDSAGIYPPKHKKVDFLLLSQSPKINLNRFIDTVRPDKIIADGSNYHSYINRWQQTCLQKKIPFHYTGEKGAYYFD
ncbi:ComEC/Rec2 family competence protein, partial [Aurantibacter sp.]|uniref:ComEC/Rec2 family competence protein n=1 Tax=Aurantibacter sp. TaxID=2807103 RepID=UPI00326465D0